MRILALIGALAIIVAIGAAMFFFGGFFSVAESQDDPAIVSWALATVRSASVTRHATDQPPASLEDPATVKSGARAYATIGCVNCHGGPPDANWAKWSEGLKPVPADLKVMAKERTAPELFEVDDYGQSTVIVDEVPAELEEKARLAIANCPEYAIEIVSE